MTFIKSIYSFMLLVTSLSPMHFVSYPAYANDIEDLEVSAKYGSFFTISGVSDVLYFYGTINQGDVREFRRALRRVNFTTLVTSSPGGNVVTALELASIINEKNIGVYVPENAECASACSLVFFAAKSRQADGRVGVHQFATARGRSSSESEAQSFYAEIIDHLNYFGAPPYISVRMGETPPESMYWLNDNEIADLNNMNKTRKIYLANLPKLRVAVESSPNVDPRLIAKAIQTELNRIGCKVGTPDGIIGKNSLNGLKRLADVVGTRLSEDMFYNIDFLDELLNFDRQVCPEVFVEKEPAREKPQDSRGSVDLTGAWGYKATCSWAKKVIGGWLEIRRVAKELYEVTAKNDIGETGVGQLRMDDFKGTVEILWNGKTKSKNSLQFSEDFDFGTGVTNNGCSFNTWKV